MTGRLVVMVVLVYGCIVFFKQKTAYELCIGDWSSYVCSSDLHTLYSSHTICHSREDFEDWTRSDAFRQAHHNAGDNKPLYLGHPRFEGFEVIQTVTPSA